MGKVTSICVHYADTDGNYCQRPIEGGTIEVYSYIAGDLNTPADTAEEMTFYCHARIFQKVKEIALQYTQSLARMHGVEIERY